MSDSVTSRARQSLGNWQPRMGRALALLVGVLMFFSVGVLAYFGMWVDWSMEKKLAFTQADRVTRTGVELQHSIIQSSKVLLDTLAVTPVVRWGTSTQMRELFKTVLPQHDQRYVWWMVVNADGSPLVRVGHGVVGLMDDTWLYSTEVTLEARLLRRFSVGDYIKVGNHFLLPMAVPVMDDSGNILRFLLVAWDVNVGADHLTDLLDPGDQLFYIAASDQVVLQYPPDLPISSATMPSATLRKALVGTVETRQFEDPDAPGGPRYVVTQPMLDDNGRLLAYVAGSVARPSFMAFVLERYYWQLLSFSVLLVVAVLLTWVFCRRFITAGLEHLTAVAMRTSMGDLAVRNDKVPGCLEVQTLARAYDQMLDSLDRNTRELADREQRLTLALDSAQQGVWTWRPDVPCLECDSRLARMLGLSGSVCLNPAEFYECINPEDRERLLAVGDLFQGHGERDFRREFRVRSNSEEGWAWLQFIGRLTPDSGNFFGIAMDVTRRKEADSIIRADAERYKILSNTDPLTGLWNRRYFTQMVTAEVRRARRYKRPFSVALCDLDHFKNVNDTYGHEAGDAVLTVFARLLQDNLRESDVVARVGGEEFAFFLPETDLSSARNVFDKIRRLTEETRIPYGDKIIHVTVSCGLVSHDIPEDPGCTYAQLLNHADTALYQAKNNGRNQVVTAGAEGA